MFDKLSKRVRILHSFFFAFEFANPVKGRVPSKHARVFILRHGTRDAETIH